MIDTSRLKPTLLLTGLAHKNQPLYQLLDQLIGIETKVAAIINSTGGIGPVGPVGADGKQGIPGNLLTLEEDIINFPIISEVFWQSADGGIWANKNYVGIGTNTPTHKLEIKSDIGWNQIALSENSSGGSIRAFIGARNSPTAIFAAIQLNRDPSTGISDDINKAVSTINFSAFNSDSNITFSTTPTNNVNSSERVRIDKDGNVGINATVPVSKLNVVGNILAGEITTGLGHARLIEIYGGSPAWAFYKNTGAANAKIWDFGAGIGGGDDLKFRLINDAANVATDWLAVVRNGTTVTYVYFPNGNVGIGQTSPTASLHIRAGTASANTAPIKIDSGTLLTTPEAGAIEFNTDAFYGNITTGPTRKTFAFREDVAVTQASGKSDAQTAAVATVATFTVGASNALFLIAANINVTTSTLHNFTCTCSYTDETNTARVLTLSFSQLTGAFVTAITNATGAGAYEGIPLAIRAKNGTAITIATTGTFTTVTYNVAGFINQVALT